MKNIAVAGVFALGLFLSGCAGVDPTDMSQYSAKGDFTAYTADRAIVVLDGVQGSGLLFDRHLELVFSTPDGQSTVVKGQTIVQDKFRTLNFYAPVSILPGRYSFLAYEYDPQGNFREFARIGGWTDQGRPLLAGFEVRAGEVVYLGHVVFIYGKQTDQLTMKLKVEDRSTEDGKSIKWWLDHNFPGAAPHLQTRLLNLYRDEIPIQSR